MSRNDHLSPFEAKLQQALDARDPVTETLDESYVRQQMALFNGLLRTSSTTEDRARFQTALAAWRAHLPASGNL